MMPITCRWVEEQLHEYLAGWGTPEERKAVDLHLADCVRCSESAKIWSFLKTTLPKNRLPPLEPLVERRLLCGKEPKLLRRMRQARRQRWTRRALVAAAAVFLVALAGIFAGGRHTAFVAQNAVEGAPALVIHPPRRDNRGELDAPYPETPIPVAGHLTGQGRRPVSQIHVAPGTALWVMPEASVEIASFTGKSARFRLESGEVIAEIGPIEPDFRFVVETADKEVEARGTVFSVQAGPAGQTLVRVAEGSVEVRDKASARGAQLVDAGHQYDGRTVHPITSVDGFSDTHFAGLTEQSVAEQRTATAAAFGSGASSRSNFRTRYDPAVDQTSILEQNSPEHLLKLAQEHRKNKQYRAAAETYEQLIGKHPRDERALVALVALGQLRLTSLDEPAGAVESFARYLALGTSRGSLYRAALAGQVRAYGRLGRHRNVIEIAGQYLDVRNTGAAAAEMYRRRGEAYQSLGDCDRAGQDFEQVIARWPSSPEATRASNGLVRCRGQ